MIPSRTTSSADRCWRNASPLEKITLRELLSNIVSYAAFVVGLAAAGAWCYWIWGFEWGRGRAAGLWWMAFGIGGLIAFLAGLFIVISLHMWLFPEKRG
jgi:hypothetical protein